MLLRRIALRQIREWKAAALLQRTTAAVLQRARSVQVRFHAVYGQEVYYAARTVGARSEQVVCLSAPGIRNGISDAELRQVLREQDLTVACSCADFLYGGYRYITYKMGAGQDSEHRAPLR